MRRDKNDREQGEREQMWVHEQDGERDREVVLQSCSAHPIGIAVVASYLRAKTAHEAAQATRQLYERLAHRSAGEYQ